MDKLSMKNRIRRVGYFISASFMVAGAVMPTVNAVDYTKDDQFYNGNNILFYDENFSGLCGTDPGNGSTTAANVEGSDIKKQIFQLLLNGGMTAVQAAAVMGNMQHESGFNPDVHEVGNDIGYGLAQWSFGRRTALESYAKAQGKPVSSVDLQIDFLLKEYNDTYKSRLAGTPFDTGKVVSSATRAWMLVFEVPAMQPPYDPAALNSARIPAANKFYELYSDLAPAAEASSDAVQTDCNADAENGVDGSTAVQGNIVETAVAYAWPYSVPNGKVNKSDARPSYQKAKMQYNPGPSWSDCGGFIATVMRASGVDPKYVSVSVAAQTAYVKANPSKYKVILNPKVSDLQPGDILLSSALGHTSMYIGSHKIDGINYTTAQASLFQQVPNLRAYGSAENYMLGHGAIIARYIGGGTTNGQ